MLEITAQCTQVIEGLSRQQNVSIMYQLPFMLLVRNIVDDFSMILCLTKAGKNDDAVWPAREFVHLFSSITLQKTCYDIFDINKLNMNIKTNH